MENAKLEALEFLERGIRDQDLWAEESRNREIQNRKSAEIHEARSAELRAELNLIWEALHA